jgi:tetratricopeptide (TPR) repeat protein
MLEEFYSIVSIYIGGSIFFTFGVCLLFLYVAECPGKTRHDISDKTQFCRNAPNTGDAMNRISTTQRNADYFSHFCFCFILFLCFLFSAKAQAQSENPFMSMTGKSYAAYHDDYRSEMDRWINDDSLSRITVNAWIKEAAAEVKTQEWALLAQHVDISVRFYELRKGKYAGATPEQSQAFVNDLLALTRAAEREGLLHIKLIALYDIANVYRFHILNYLSAFEYYLQLVDELDKLTTRDFPPRAWMYNDLAALYYQFDDYANAIVYYTKVINDHDVVDNYYYPRPMAYHGLGLCYRNGYKDYGKSDEYFRAIYTLP